MYRLRHVMRKKRRFDSPCLDLGPSKWSQRHRSSSNSPDAKGFITNALLIIITWFHLHIIHRIKKRRIIEPDQFQMRLLSGSFGFKPRIERRIAFCDKHNSFCCKVSSMDVLWLYGVIRKEDVVAMENPSIKLCRRSLIVLLAQGDLYHLHVRWMIAPVSYTML